MARTMTVWRTGVAVMALALSATGAGAQTVPAPDTPVLAEALPQPPFMSVENGLVWVERPPFLIDDEQALRDLPLPPFAVALPAELEQTIDKTVDAETLLKTLDMPEFSALPADLAPPVAESQAVRQALKSRLAAFTGDAAIATTYEQRGYAPFFVEADAVGAKARAVADRLALAADDGLNPDVYATDVTVTGNAEALAELDLRLARHVVAYARHASGGRLDTTKLSGYVTVQPDVIGADIALKTVSEASSVEQALDSFNPPHEGFRHLRAKLAELRLKSGAEARVAEREIGIVLGNMERWRWLPRDLGETHIWVNIPDYLVSIIDKGSRVYQTRVVVGTAKTQTPVFSHEMETVVINPAWNVPPSILAKEMLGAARRDPNYFARRGYQVIKGGRVVDPASIDWSNPGRVAVRQPPGERNALGKMKFLFPNRHAVYLHDTPSRALFAHERRAYSHGCVRVHQPLSFAEKVLELANGDENWSAGRIEGLYGSSERSIRLKRKLPIHLVYFTADVDGDGELRLREDIYGHDARITQALAVAKARLAQNQ